MNKQFVKIMFPGSSTSNDIIQEIESREAFKIPENAFAYQFFDKKIEEVDGELLYGSPKNLSKTFYVGEVFTLADVKEKVKDNKILVSNMEINGWDKVIKCRQGFLPFDEHTCSVL